MKWVKNTVIIGLTVGFTVFMFGKTENEPVNLTDLAKYTELYEQQVAELDTSSLENTALLDQYMTLKYEFTQIDDDRTLYNRLLRADYYFDEEETRAANALQKRLQIAEDKFAQKIFAPKQDFQQVIDGQIDDPAVKVIKKKNRITMEIDGQVSNYSVKGYTHIYFKIWTPNGEYYWEQPDHTSASFSANYIKMDGEINYIIKPTHETVNW